MVSCSAYLLDGLMVIQMANLMESCLVMQTGKRWAYLKEIYLVHLLAKHLEKSLAYSLVSKMVIQMATLWALTMESLSEMLTESDSA